VHAAGTTCLGAALAAARLACLLACLLGTPSCSCSLLHRYAHAAALLAASRRASRMALMQHMRRTHRSGEVFGAPLGSGHQSWCWLAGPGHVQVVPGLTAACTHGSPRVASSTPWVLAYRRQLAWPRRQAIRASELLQLPVLDYSHCPCCHCAQPGAGWLHRSDSSATVPSALLAGCLASWVAGCLASWVAGWLGGWVARMP
jgi:hypothetical protein